MGGVFAVSDLHLPKRIQIKKFGYPINYLEQVESRLKAFNPHLLLNAGDFSYEHNIRRGLPLLYRIKAFPGNKKVFVEGNHDTFLHDEKNREYIRNTFNTSECYYLSGRTLILNVVPFQKDNIQGTISESKKVGLCGAMGWMVNDRSFNEYDLIMFQKELDTLEDSLTKLEGLREEIFTDINICLLHHPPSYTIYTDRRKGDERLFSKIQEFKFINSIVYGHIHKEKSFKIYKKVKGIHLYCAAIDQLGFRPIRIKI